jgi:predicted ester cyclase
MTPRRLFVEIPKKCKVVEISISSRISSPTTSLTIHPNPTPNKDGVRKLYHALRGAFPDFHADIHWQAADGSLVTTYKTYHGTHKGPFLGVAPTGRLIHFETVDVMRVREGKITEHWGVANLFSLMQQLGTLPAST